ARLRAHVCALVEWDDEKDAELDKELDATVRAAQKEAEAMGILPQQGFDNIPSMFEDVYSETPWHLAEQRDQALDEAREFLGHEPKRPQPQPRPVTEPRRSRGRDQKGPKPQPRPVT